MPATHGTREAPSPARRGGIYIAVLGTVTVITIMGLTAMAVHRASLNRARLAADTTRANALARSAIEIGLAQIHADPDWRENKPSTLWINNKHPGASSLGRFDLSVIDPLDGDYENDPTHPVLLVGTGRFGLAERSISVSLDPLEPPMECLTRAAYVKGNHHTPFGSSLNGSGVYRVERNITNGTGLIAIATEANGNINGSVYTTTKTQKLPDKLQSPDVDGLATLYQKLGTEINVNDIGLFSGNREIKHVVLSPRSNPYGSREANPLGVYWVDAQGQTLGIREARIVGTLVIFNAAADSELRREVNWTPAQPGWPALIVVGDFRFDSEFAALSESAKGVNFNPAGTPNASGATDSDLADSYPAEIQGVVAISGNLTVRAGSTTMRGVLIVGGNVTQDALSSLNTYYDSAPYDNVPPGLGDGSIVGYALRNDWARLIP